MAWSHILGEPGLDPATASRAVQAIDRNARAQAQLVADILDVSRIITGKFHMSLGPVRLCDVIEAAADTVRPAARARDIRLELAIDPEAGPVWGDASRLQQVVWNLLSNAVKFAPAGGRVDVRLEDAGSCVELSVTDDGPGIDPAFLPYVFDRFRQADCLEHSPARRPGSRIGHRAAPGRAARRERRGAEPRGPIGRHVDRPAAAAASAPRPRVRRASQAASTHARGTWVQPEPSLQDVSVLVVDDEEDAREAMAIGLGRHGARVATASSASEALSALARERPQVLVADIGMAGEDGYALLRNVRALPAERGGATPAIALTGYANQQDRADALRAGFQMHVSKPVTPAELAVAVASLVAAAPPGAPSR